MHCLWLAVWTCAVPCLVLLPWYKKREAVLTCQSYCRERHHFSLRLLEAEEKTFYSFEHHYWHCFFNSTESGFWGWAVLNSLPSVHAWGCWGYKCMCVRECQRWVKMGCKLAARGSPKLIHSHTNYKHSLTCSVTLPERSKTFNFKDTYVHIPTHPHTTCTWNTVPRCSISIATQHI